MGPKYVREMRKLGFLEVLERLTLSDGILQLQPILSVARHSALNLDLDSPDRTSVALLNLLLQAQATLTVSE